MRGPAVCLGVAQTQLQVRSLLIMKERHWLKSEATHAACRQSLKFRIVLFAKYASFDNSSDKTGETKVLYLPNKGINNHRLLILLHVIHELYQYFYHGNQTYKYMKQTYTENSFFDIHRWLPIPVFTPMWQSQWRMPLTAFDDLVLYKGYG